MLINFQGIFDHKERFQMFKENRVEMLWLSPRVNYDQGEWGAGGQGTVSKRLSLQWNMRQAAGI